MLKATFYWTQLSSRVVGWSESFWAPNTTISTTVRTEASNLLSLLFALKGRQTASLGYRLSLWNDNGTPTRESSLVTPDLVTAVNPNKPSNITSDYPTVAYLLQAEGGNPVRSTRQWVRGIIDETVIEGGKIDKQLRAEDRAALLNALNSGIWGNRSRIQTGNPKVVIDNFDAETDTFLTASPHGFLVNDRVSLSGLSTSPQLQQNVNGQYTVSAVPNNAEFRLQGYNIPTGISLVIGTRGKVQKIAYGVFTSTWKILRVTSRQAGRPFGSPSGRLQKKRR